MNPRVWLLALATFVTGIAENIVIGILPALSENIGVSLGVAGQLTTAFSVAFAVTAPGALFLAARWERRRLFRAALAFFVICNLLAAASPGYGILLIARIGMAAASALTCLLATMMATELASKQHKGRAIGVIFMGISGSLILGVPAGIVICEAIGWRGVFLSMAALAAAVLLVTGFSLPRFGRSRPVRIASYIVHLRDVRLLSSQAVSVLMIGGHFTLFAYLAPYVGQVLEISGSDVVFAFAAFGLAGVCGGYLGGWMADAVGSRRAIVITPTIYLVSLLALPFSAVSAFWFIPCMMIWGCISWMISPVVQSHLVKAGPATAEAGISLNLSAMHLGVGLGTAVGGTVVSVASLQATPFVGAALAALAVAAAARAIMGVPGKPGAGFPLDGKSLQTGKSAEAQTSRGIL
jgi:DHA1 family purine base/nucleoside efflux pump-like MFS transporter